MKRRVESQVGKGLLKGGDVRGGVKIRESGDKGGGAEDTYNLKESNERRMDRPEGRGEEKRGE